MKKTLTTFVFLCAFTSSAVFAQTPETKMKREIGTRMQGINITNFNFNFIYKKQKSEDKYCRLRFISGNFIIREFKGFNNDFSVSIAAGKEKRKSLSDKLYFVKGWEFIGSLNETNNNYFDMRFSPGLGVVIGFQYNFNDKFRASLEAIPSITTSVSYTGFTKEFHWNNLNARMNSNDVALSLMYAF